MKAVATTALAIRIAVGILLVVTLAVPARLGAQASLAAARQLYSAAEYDDALAMLNALRDGLAPAGERASVEFYRALCFLAIGELGQATEAVGLMVSRDPFYRPTTDDVPPRLRSVVSDVRQRALPSVAQSHYVRAKAAYERGDFTVASELFAQVLAQLDDPDLAALVTQSPLSDLRLLASGFNQLSRKALEPPPTVAPSAVAPERPAPPRIFGADDPDVSAPVVVRQAVPTFRGRVPVARTGVVEVVIDETGIVEAATMLIPVDPTYDRLVVTAAKGWAYSPARRDGMPVKYRKRIQITVSPERDTSPR